MFRENKQHLQSYLISNVKDLLKNQRKPPDKSWAWVIHCEFFYRLNEEPFSVLCTVKPSRPNMPVNVLVGLEYVKAGFGWSDEELHDTFIYNMQVRYALGYHQLGNGNIDLCTLYNFHQHISRHMQEQEGNLMEQVFEQVTDENFVAFQNKTGKQCKDSTLVTNRTGEVKRLKLLVVVLQRVHNTLCVETCVKPAF